MSRIRVLDQSGKSVKVIKVANTNAFDLQMASIPEGIYYIEVETTAGMARQQVWVQH